MERWLKKWVGGWMKRGRVERERGCYSEGQRGRFRAIRTAECTGEGEGAWKSRPTWKQACTDRESGELGRRGIGDSEGLERRTRNGREAGREKDTLRKEKEELALGSLGNIPAPIHHRQPHAPSSTAASPASPAPRHRRIPPLRCPPLAAPRQPRSLLRPRRLLSTASSPLRCCQLRPGAEPCAGAARGLGRAQSAQWLCRGASWSPAKWTLPLLQQGLPSKNKPAQRQLQPGKAAWP